MWDVEEPTFLIILSRKKEMRQNRKRNRKNLWRHCWPTVDTIPQLSSLQVHNYSYFLYDYIYTKGWNFSHFTYNVSFIDKNLIVRINKLTGKQLIILQKSKPWNIYYLKKFNKTFIMIKLGQGQLTVKRSYFRLG